jgi:RNA polymerase sigma-70 factor (ECF subfamily)
MQAWPSLRAGASVGLTPASSSSDAQFSDSVRPHLRRALRLAERILGSPDLAWDAVQEALLAMWKLDPRPTDTGPWLRRAVLHRSLHARRTRRRRFEHERRCGSGCACPVEDPHRILERAEMHDRLEAALASLPADYRSVVELRELEGYDYAEISRSLRLPVGTVRSRLHRARAMLRSRFRHQGRDDAA